MKIPKDSKKVFSGVLFDVYHWEQEMYDGTRRTFEMLERKATVDIIATVGDKIVALRQEQPSRPPFPSLPGGKIEAGQTPLEAARAELMQETGLDSDDIMLIKEFQGSSKIYFHEYLFVAKDCVRVSDQNLDGGEKIEVELMDFDSFLQLCRNELFTAPQGLKHMMYEALLDRDKYLELKNIIFCK